MTNARRRSVLACSLLVAAIAGSCVITQRRITSSTLDFLYPQGSPAVEASDVELRLPVRVGIAFAPETAQRQTSFSEDQKQSLLRTVATAMEARDGLASIQVVPSTYLDETGGFGNLDRLKTAFGIDVITLLSYDQIQFSDTTRKSWAYWTLVGAYIVKGEKNETRTMLDAAVVHIPSRALLFTASGQSAVEGKATPIDVTRELRRDSETGFAEAVDDLVGKLAAALDAFETQAATGTVRGQGTPAITMIDDSGAPVTGGGGASGAVELVALLALIGVATIRRSR